MLLSSALLLQVPSVQTSVAKAVSSKLESSFNGSLKIGSLQIHPFNAISIKDAVLLDAHPFDPALGGRDIVPIDTVAYIGRLSATVSLKSLLLKHRGFELGRVEAEDLLFQLTNEPDKEFGTNLTRVLNMVSSQDSTSISLDSLFTVHKLDVKNAHFRMVSYTYRMDNDYGIDFSDMDVRFDAKGHDISFNKGRMHAVADHIRAVEKSGMEVLHLSGACHVGLGKTILENVHMTDASGSDIYIPDAVLSYSGTADWGDFVQKLRMDVDFAPSRVVLESISYFSAGTFRDCKFVTDVQSGRYYGTVSDFTATDFVCSTPYGPTAKVSATMKGLPQVQQTSLDATIDELHFTATGLQEALRHLGANVKLSGLAPKTVFTLRGKASGLLNKLHAGANIRSNAGSLDATAWLRNAVNSKPIEFDAQLTANALDLGKILSSQALGSSDFVASVNGNLGGGHTTVKLDRMDISRLGALGYEYGSISLYGSLTDQKITASLRSDDPNALISLDGLFELRDKYAQLQADFREVDLAALNIDKRGGASTVSFSLSGDQGINRNAPVHVQVSNLQLTNDSGTKQIGDIELEARLYGQNLVAILNSNFMDAKYFGPQNFGALIKYAKSISVGRDLPAFFPSTEKEEPEAVDATLSAIFHDTKGLLAFVMPELAIAPQTTVNLDVASDGTLLGYITTPQLKYGKLQANGLMLALDNQDESLSCTLNSDAIKAGSINFDKAGIKLDAASNTATLGAHYEAAELFDNGSELNLSALLLRDEQGRPSIDLRTLPSYLRIKNDVWVLPRSSVRLHGGAIDVDHFRLASESQSIAIDGGIHPTQKDTLQVSLRNLDLSILNDFTKESFPELQGTLHGDATILSPVPSALGIWGEMTLSSLSVDQHPAGDISLRSIWDDARKRVLVRLNNTVADSTLLNIRGNYTVADKRIDAIASLSGFNVGVGAPFLKSFVTELDGRMSGELHATGPLDKLKLSSEAIQLDSVRTRISYTNVAYTLDGTATIDDKGLHFGDIKLADDYGGRGTLSGGIAFHELKDFRMDATMRMRNLKAIDIPDEDSPIMVYGDLALSGRSHISGPFNNLYVDADVATSGDGNVNVPISSSSTASKGNDLLTFTQPAAESDDAAESTSTRRQQSGSRFSAHARVRLTPEVIANVEIDKESGHVLSAGGSGVVVFDLNTAKAKMQLNGDYNIDKGKYLFNVPGVVSKEFDIKSGSTIKFNGDVMESALDVHAIHNVKTSLATLVADSTSVSSRRNVECGINISGKLKNPDVSFAINVPDLDPNTKMQVEGALNTQDKIQKQFVALLLFGTFLPEEGSGVVNGTNMIASNVGEIVSSQLNNILQKLNIPLDFGLGYQQDQVGTDIFDVAVSTQLFNNRVLVNGSVGNRKYSTSKSAYGDVVGDIDIEIKMDRSGELRFKLFSHSADEFSSSLDFSQRNGLGFSYQKEFDHTREFIRQIFMSRKKKNEAAMREAAASREMKTIVIE